MTPDQYVESVLLKYTAPVGANSPSEIIGSTVAGPIRAWAGNQLNSLEYSGSYAKGTAIHGVSDADIFISLKADTTNSLKDLYEGVYSLAESQGWSPRRQNVSIGIIINGNRGDLVSGKVQSGYQNYHSLYLSKRDSWTQTNVANHIQIVSQSQRIKEIKAIKIWKALRQIDFPSLYLELFTINALNGHSRNAVATNVITVLRTIGSSLSSTRIVDPSNTNNILSDELTKAEKDRISALAALSAVERSWANIIW
ncbi:nucleotidyltransferase domain-containing protein [bacterium]|nr:nucleotidyltransferase domain-containing protein [bacterium]